MAYFKAIFFWPSYGLHHWGRMVFAFVNLFGMGNLQNWGRRQLPTLDTESLDGWPGLSLNHDDR
jgi:hypothetical protein